MKAMALISKTRTYDTFLMNTRGGALYTVRIPISSPMKPIVKVVRSTHLARLRVVHRAEVRPVRRTAARHRQGHRRRPPVRDGHANGTATVIKGLGRVPGTFNDPVYFRWGVIPVLDPIFGE